jgi:hypothetical protein
MRQEPPKLRQLIQLFQQQLKMNMPQKKFPTLLDQMTQQVAQLQ